MRTRRSVRLTNIAEKTAETRKVVDRATVYALDGIVSHVMFDRVHTRTRIAVQQAFDEYKNILRWRLCVTIEEINDMER
jgi:hypothetical protein